MNKKVVYIVAMMLVMITGYAGKANKPVTLKFSNMAEPLRLQVGDQFFSVQPKDDKTAVFTTQLAGEGYVRMYRLSSRSELLYLYPGDELEVNIQGPVYGKLLFTGSHAQVNQYLADPDNAVLGGGFTLDETGYINFLQEKIAAAVAKMKEAGFGKAFEMQEQKRIQAKIFTSLVTYPSLRKRTEKEYKPSDSYMNFIKQVLFEDETMLMLDEYTQFIQYLYQMIAVKDMVKYDVHQNTLLALQYVEKNIKSPAIRAHLVNYYAYDYLKRNGIEKLEPVTAIFKKYVTSEQHLKQYNETVDTWSKIAPGAKLSDFTFYDVNGNTVLPSSLKGKYLYIDVWATWCKPCIAEIPNLKKLEHAMENKNIAFVSISVDKDGDAWKKMVKDDNFTGIQWHARTRDFSKNLMIVSIPRFILIGRNGEIIEANMTRPGKPETYERLQQLPGI